VGSPDVPDRSHIRNSQRRAEEPHYRREAEGRGRVSAGVPDLYIPRWRCWVEMKREKGGTVSPVQKDWLNYLKNIGDTVIVGNGCEDAKKQIQLLFK
jgi:hypothetical protein